MAPQAELDDMDVHKEDEESWTCKRSSVNAVKNAQLVRALTPSFSPKDGMGAEIKAQRPNSPPGLSMTVGGDKMASQRPSLSSQRPSLSDGPVVLRATTGYICTKAPSSGKDEIYPSWVGNSSNTSLNSSEDDVLSAARTVVGEPQEPENGYVLGLHAVPVQGQGSSGIGISFRPVEGGAQIVRINERGSAALHGGLKVGQVFCSINGISAAGKSIAELVLMITGEPGSQCNLELQDASGINQTVSIDRMVVPPPPLDDVLEPHHC